MELYHLQDKTGSTFLYLCLNKQDGKSYGLKSANVPEEEASVIRKNIPRLKSSQKPYHIEWLKTNTPISYKTAYRELNLENYTILSTYDVK